MTHRLSEADAKQLGSSSWPTVGPAKLDTLQTLPLANAASKSRTINSAPSHLTPAEIMFLSFQEAYSFNVYIMYLTPIMVCLFFSRPIDNKLGSK